MQQFFKYFSTFPQIKNIDEAYMNQLINANSSRKVDALMCCEEIFRLYGTSSNEIAEKAVAPVMAQLNKTLDDLNKIAEDLNKTTEDLNSAQKQIKYLQQLLAQNGIPYNVITE